MYGGYPTILLAVREDRPWEDDAYFITEGSAMFPKEGELHCAVIANWSSLRSEADFKKSDQLLFFCPRVRLHQTAP